MPRKYALFVGNSEYDSEGLVNLDAPLADVRDLASIFRDSAIGGFDEVTELINSTESEIRQKISSFFLHKKPDDLLLLYFSGHGVLDDRGHLYLAVKDTRPDLLRATAISADFIADDMDLCRSKRQILILDCCHSGAFRRGIKADDQVLTATTFEGNGSGRIVLTASDRREFAMEGNQVLETAKTSLFTHFLLEGITSGEADQDGDSLISLDEWYDYAYQKVVENLPSQTPRRWVYNQEGKLIIARNPCPLKPVVLTDELQELIAHPEPAVRIKAISSLGEILHGPDKRMAEAARKGLEKLTNDDHAEVQKSAERVLRGIPVSVDKPKPQSPLNQILVLIQKSRWRTWALAASVVIVVGFLGWGLSQTTEQGNFTEGGEPLSVEQAEGQIAGLGGGNKLLPEESSGNQAEKKDILPAGEADAGDPQENSSPGNSSQSPEILKTEDNKNEGGQDHNILSDAGMPNKEQDIVTNPDEGENTTEAKDISQLETDNEGQAPQPVVEEPLDRLKSEIGDMQKNLKEAVMKGEFTGLPAPLVDSYGKILETLYTKFNVIAVDLENGGLQSDGSTASLPVALRITYVQKGRDYPANELPMKAEWTWKKGTDGFVLDTVERL